MSSRKRAKSTKTSQVSQKIDTVLARLKKQNPDPRCELVYHSPFQLLVSVVLSAQATDKSVNQAMAPLYEKPFTPEIVLQWGEQNFLSKIRKIGLAPTKARNVLKLSQILKDQYASQVPKNRDDLEALPGVGRKTASVILGEIFREPTLAVDTHVYRVTHRLGFQSETSPQAAEPVLMRVVDPKWLPTAHHWFILHGRYTCTAKSPRCAECILADLCPSAGLTSTKVKR